MREDIVGMGRLFNPVGIHGAQPTTDVDRLGQRPLLIDIQHHAGLVADCLPHQEGAPDIPRRIRRADLELDGVEAAIQRLDDILLDGVVAVVEPADRGIVAGVAAGEN